MAATPRWKVYNRDGEYIAACKYPEDAAVLVAVQGDGATIRLGHRVVVFEQGADGDAGESYDQVAALCHQFELLPAKKGV